MEKQVYSGTEINTLVRDVEEKVTGEKYAYPVMIDAVGRGGRPKAVLVRNLVELESKTFTHDKNGTVIKGETALYEFDAQDGTKQKIRLAKTAIEDQVELLRTSADLLEYAEGMRKLTNLNIMTNKVMDVLVNNPNVGLLLSDKLLNNPGVSVVAEREIRECLGGVKAPIAQVNAATSKHTGTRTLVYMKDRYASAFISQYIEGCRQLANALEAGLKVVQPLDIQSTGVQPTVINEAPMQVTEIAHSEPKKDMKSIM